MGFGTNSLGTLSRVAIFQDQSHRYSQKHLKTTTMSTRDYGEGELIIVDGFRLTIHGFVIVRL